MASSRAVVLVLSLMLLSLVVIGVVLIIPSSTHHEEDTAPASIRLLEGPRLYGMSSSDLDDFLAGLYAAVPSLDDRLRILAVRRIGTPYRGDCLGEETSRDPDPLFRVDSTDCTVFILTQAAMAHASSLSEARESMRMANYHGLDGHRPTTYENRLHFTVDRLRSSPYFRDITAEVAGDKSLREATVTLNRKADGTRLLAIDWEKEVTVAYVPVADLTDDLLDRLPPVTGVALVREKYFDMGLVTAHEGILLDGRDFVHGSSEKGKVVIVPFLEYLRPADEPPRFDGVIFYEFR